MAISRDEYLKALEIVDAYHKQFREEIGIYNSTNKHDLRLCKDGDFVTCVKAKSKFLTIGKKYQLINVGHIGKQNWWGELRNDRGDKLHINNAHNKMWENDRHK